jgi:hypothetical protein
MKGRGLTPAYVQSQKGKEVKEVFLLYFFHFFYFFDFAVKLFRNSVPCPRRIPGRALDYYQNL